MIAGTAALIGVPGRASMLAALMDGRAHAELRVERQGCDDAAGTMTQLRGAFRD